MISTVTRPCDTIALSWIKSELDLALDGARTPLGLDQEEPPAAAALLKCRDLLHQAAGTLELADLPAEARFAAEAETAAALMASRDFDPSLRNRQALDTAIVRLAGHLSDLAGGRSTHALSLFPAYRQLQRARGIDTPSPVDLFYPAATGLPPAIADQPPLDATARATWLQHQQLLFEAALGRWFDGDTGAYAVLHESLAAVDAVCDDPGWRRFWWIVTAWFEQLDASTVPDAALRPVTTRVALQIRKLMLGREAPGLRDPALRELLYSVLRGGGDAPRLVETRRLFAASLPEGDLDPADGAARATAQALRRLLASAIRHWVRVCCGDQERLRALNLDLAQTAGLLDGLSGPSAAPLLRLARNMAGRLPTDQPPAPAIQVAMAAVLMFIEAMLIDPADPTSEGATANALAHLLRQAFDPAAAAASPPAPAVAILDAAHARLAHAAAGTRILQQLRQAESLIDRYFRDHNEQAGLSLVRLALSDIETALNQLGLHQAAAAVRRTVITLDRMTRQAADRNDEVDQLAIAGTISALMIALADLPDGELRWRGMPGQTGPAAPGDNSLEADWHLHLRRDAAAATRELQQAVAAGCHGDALLTALAGLRERCRMAGLATAGAVLQALIEAPETDPAAAGAALTQIGAWLDALLQGEQPVIDTQMAERIRAGQTAAAGLPSVSVTGAEHRPGPPVVSQEAAAAAPETEEIDLGPVRVNRTLHGLVLRELSVCLERLGAATRGRPAAACLADEVFLRDVGAVRDIARTIGCAPITDITAVIEDWAVKARTGTTPPVDVACAGVQMLMQMRDALAQRTWPQSGNGLASPPPTPAPAAPPAPAIDAGLAPVFLEEADELVPAINRILREWRAGRTDAAQLADLKRMLHTLKGSARMAGCQDIGQTAHDMESDVVRALDAQQMPDNLMDRLETRLDGISERLRQLRGGSPAEPPEPAPAGPAQPAESEAEPAALPAVIESAVKIPATTLDELVDDTGEITIARTRLAEAMTGIREAMQEMTRHLARLQQQVREIEIQADSGIASRPRPDQDNPLFDPLEFDRFTRLHELTRSLDECSNDLALTHGELNGQLGQVDAVVNRQSRLVRTLQDRLMDIRLVPFGSVTERFYQVVRLACRETGKQVELIINGSDTAIDRGVLERIVPSIEHLLRNAVDHGIETELERRRAGKPARGQITLSASSVRNEVLIILEDDGRGIGIDRVRNTARQLGMLRADEDLPAAHLFQMIFRPGFSTAEKVTQLSGRGIGLDVVQTTIVGVGGRIEVSSEDGGGARFFMTLPQSLSSLSVMLVAIQSELYALPTSFVDQAVHPSPAELAAAVTAGVWSGSAGDWPLRALGRLVGLADAAPGTGSLVLLNNHQERLALQVDAVLGSQDIVLKGGGPLLERAPIVYGATILADGRELIVLNPIALTRLGDFAPPPLPPAAPAPPPPLILIVDDSVTVRKVTSSLMMREGYQVVLATDGLDALDKIHTRRPDILLVDIEMPRMDGFELTRHLRDAADLASLPVIMITSRTAEKHREHARGLGVDAFLGKPWREEELLGEVRRLLPPRVG